jgi:DNA-binding Lrp family transcriptional regulator
MAAVEDRPMTRDGADGPRGADLGWELSTAVVLFHEAVAQRLGLSAVDHKALGLISRAGALTAGELAQRTGLSPGAVTGLVDRLEAAGHVRRTRDPADRRRVVITPVSAPGRPDLSGIFAELGAAMAAFAGDYDAHQARAIEDYLVKTIAVLQEQTRRLSAGALVAGADRGDADG